jgi:hypothetical protein
MGDLVGPGAPSGELSPSASSSRRSPADAAVTIAGIAAIVALAFHHDVSGTAALAALAAAMVPEASPLGPAKRLLAKLLKE